jgi:benzoate-CoA ligase
VYPDEPVEQRGSTASSAAVHTIASPSHAFNFARHIIELNVHRAAKVAYTDDRGDLTYGDLARRVRSFADSLHTIGLRREQRVLLLLSDGNEWPVAFLGALYAGIVPVPVNTLLTPDDYAYLIDHSGSAGAIVSRHILKNFTAGLARSTSRSCGPLIGAGPDLPGDTDQDVIDFSTLVSEGNSSYNGESTHADAMAFWLYSSGSTGRPKGVVHTHANLFWTCELYAKRVLGLTEHDKVFSAAKLFFAYGLGNALSFPLTAGASVVLMADRPTPESVFTRLKQHQPTIFCGAPTLYAGMIASDHLPPKSSVALRLCTSAGEALPREVGERFTRHFNVEIVDGLGSTEMLHIFLSNRPGDIRYGTTGKPVEGYEVEIRDECGIVLAPNQIGDLWVRGPSAAVMYWNDRAKTRDTFHGPWLRTGDKYTCLEDGYFVYAGRNDDMLRISGQYVSPFEVESALIQHEAVLESAVVGVPDGFGISKCKAFIVLQAGVIPSATLASELQFFVKERLAPFKRPHFVEFVSELPKTTTGKIQRFKLRELRSPG